MASAASSVIGMSRDIPGLACFSYHAHPSLHCRPFFTLTAILHPPLPPCPPVLCRPCRPRLLLHQLPGRRAALPKAGAGSRSRARVAVRLAFDDPDATEQSIRLATTLFTKLYSEAIVPVARSYADLGHAPLPPTAEQHLQLLKPSSVPHRACSLRPRY